MITDNKQEVWIVAPTIHYGEYLARIFGIRKDRITSNPDLFVGKSNCVILFCEGSPWNLRKKERWMQVLVPGNHTLIGIPEIHQVLR